MTLTTDPTQDLRDRYGRVLAYVDVSEGPPITSGAAYELEETMLVAGWAQTYDFERDGKLRRLSRYVTAERSADRNDSGVWSSCAGNFHSEQR